MNDMYTNYQKLQRFSNDVKNILPLTISESVIIHNKHMVLAQQIWGHGKYFMQSGQELPVNLRNNAVCFSASCCMIWQLNLIYLFYCVLIVGFGFIYTQ